MKGLWILCAALILFFSGCDSDKEKGYDYLASSFIDTVLAADTIQNGDLVPIVHVYPEGCNYFERFESSQDGNTLELSVIYHYYYAGLPCAHGSGLDTTSYPLMFSSAGACTLTYRRGDTAMALQTIFVKD